MDNNSVGHALASMVLETLKLYDARELSLARTKELIAFAVEVADSFDTDVSIVTELMQDRCSVCLRKFDDEEESQLVSWSPEVTYEDDDPRSDWAQVAFNNCFGEVMVGGTVCLNCVTQLPPEGPEE